MLQFGIAHCLSLFKGIESVISSNPPCKYGKYNYDKEIIDFTIDFLKNFYC